MVPAYSLLHALAATAGRPSSQQCMHAAHNYTRYYNYCSASSPAQNRAQRACRSTSIVLSMDISPVPSPVATEVPADVDLGLSVTHARLC